MSRDAPRDPSALSPSRQASLARAGQETLEALFEEWDELRAHRATSIGVAAAELKRLDEQGEFLLGAVRAATSGPTQAPGLEKSGLTDFVRQAQEKLSAARVSLEKRVRDEESARLTQVAELKCRIRSRVEAFALAVKPRIVLMVRVLGERRVVHLARLSQDESHLLLFLLTGKIAVRSDFLFDDSTDDAALSPAPLYADEGISRDATRLNASALERVLRAISDALPIKGLLPVWIPSSTGEDFFVARQRGAVMEVEVRDGDAFRNLLTRDEAERFAGHLLRLKLEGRIELELEGNR